MAFVSNIKNALIQNILRESITNVETNMFLLLNVRNTQIQNTF